MLSIPASMPGLESAALERTIAAGKLWATINFFHPYLAYREIEWDGAWLKAASKIESASGQKEYREAIESMLAVLNDPATHVVNKELELPPTGGEVQTNWIEDAVLVVSIPNSEDFSGVGRRLREVGSNALPQAKAVIFDLRSASETAMYGFDISGVSRLLSSTPVVGPGTRRRFHSGLADADASSSGGYFSAFSISDGKRYEPEAGAKDIRSVFLLGNRVPIPPIALALQTAGKAQLVNEGSMVEDSSELAIRLGLPEGLEVSIRMGELVHADGTTGLRPDATAAENEGLQTALRLLKDPEMRASHAPARVPSVGTRRPGSSASEPYPTPEGRLLAAIKIWSVHHYFYPYKGLMGEDWDAVFKTFLSKFRAAPDARTYHLSVAEMVSHVHDTHAYVSSPVLSEYLGTASPPVRLRWIENRPVVVHVVPEAGNPLDVQPGDAILEIDGHPVGHRVEELAKHISASTPQALMHRVRSYLLAGPDDSTVQLKIRKPQGELNEVQLTRKRKTWQRPEQRTGEIVRIMKGNIGYADLDRLPGGGVDEMFEKFRNTRAIIFDMRGYPNGTAWPIAPRLSKTKSPVAALFRRPLVMFPGGETEDMQESATYSFQQRIPGTDRWLYEQPTVMLIDERTISQAEHTGLFFSAANGTKFIGTPSNGANGDVTSFTVPGGIRISMTGHDVRHADGRQLQRVGLTPDIQVAPTIAGIAAGRDEVLERAIQYLESSK